MSSQLNTSFRKNLLSQLSNIFSDDAPAPNTSARSLVVHKYSVDRKITEDQKDGRTQLCSKLHQNEASKEDVKANVKEETVTGEDQRMETNDRQTETNDEKEKIEAQQLETNGDQPVKVKQERKRADSIEEIEPKDPFEGILEECIIEQKFELEDVKIEPMDYEYDAEDCGVYPEEEKNKETKPIVKKHRLPLPPSCMELRTKKALKPTFCEICYLRFNTTDLYQDHMDSAHQSTEFKHICKLCGLYYVSKSGLKKHMSKMHTDTVGSLQCSICSKTISGITKLHEHWEQEHNLKKHELFTSKCSQCLVMFHDIASLNAHIKSKHKKSGRNKVSKVRHNHRKLRKCREVKNRKTLEGEVFQCIECKALYQKESLLMKHMTIVHKVTTGLSVEMLDCELCGLTVLGARNLKRHMINQHSDRTFDCLMCSATFKNTDALRKHVTRNHHGQTSETNGHEELKCKECDLIFTTTPVRTAWAQLQNHVHRKHTGVNTTETKLLENKCMYCDNIYTEDTLQNHMKIEHKELMTLHKCTECTYETYDQKLFADHHEIHHSGTQVNKCWYDGCNYVNVNKNNLDRHIFNQHEEMKKCQSCPFETKNEFLMTKHMHDHNKASSSNQSKYNGGSNNFKCDDCGYTTQFFSALWIHKKRKHTESTAEKPMKCNQCAFVTHGYRNMLRHRKTHEAKYLCKLCSFKTKNPASLETHKKYKHPDVDTPKFQCNMCSFSSLYLAYMMVHKQIKHNDKEAMLNLKEKTQSETKAKSYTSTESILKFKLCTSTESETTAKSTTSADSEIKAKLCTSPERETHDKLYVVTNNETEVKSSTTDEIETKTAACTSSEGEIKPLVTDDEIE